MKYMFSVGILSLMLLLTDVSLAEEKGYELSEKEAAALKFSKEIALELVKKINESGDPKKLEALTFMNEMSLIKSFLVSRTLVVPVTHCQRIPLGEKLKNDYDQWIDVAKDDIRNGYEIIKNGYRGKSYEEMEKSTIDKIEQLEADFSNLSENELVEQCKKIGKLVSFYMSGYE